jgi:hypothetical protein
MNGSAVGVAGRWGRFIGAGATVAFCLAMTTVVATGADGVPLKMGFDEKGLNSISAGDTPLLKDGQVRVTAARFTRPDGSVAPAADTTPTSVSADARERRVKWTYGWGVVQAAYEVSGNRLNVIVDVANTTAAETLFSLQLQVMELVFPSVPKGLDGKANMGTGIGSMTIIVADWETGRAVLVNDDLTRPLALGFGAPSDKEKRVYPLLAFTGRHPLFPNTFSYIDRPVPPGGVDRYRLSLRVGPPRSELTEDVYKAFAEAFPYKLKWEDRRPIGMLFASSRGNVSSTNPRGWISKKYDAVVDTNRTEFRKGMLDTASRAVALCREANAQGVILWDPEGQEWPHPTSYLGDPRSLPPEMDAVADEFFGAFTVAKTADETSFQVKRGDILLG